MIMLILIMLVMKLLVAQELDILYDSIIHLFIFVLRSKVGLKQVLLVLNLLLCSNVASVYVAYATNFE